MIKFRLIALATAASVVSVTLTGCSILPDPPPPPAIYRLSVDSEAVTPRADAMRLNINRPSVSGVLNSKAIITSSNGPRLSSIAQANWSERLPGMIQAGLVSTFRGSDAVIALLPSSGTRSDYNLTVIVNNFEANFDQGDDRAPNAIVNISVELTDTASRELVGAYTTQQIVRAEERRVEKIVDALNMANRRAMQDIVDWVALQPAVG